MEVARQIVSVALVFVLLGTALWALRRWGTVSIRGLVRRSSGRTKSLEPVERLALTPQHSIHLVRMHGHELLVVTHPQGCTLLRESSRGAGV